MPRTWGERMTKSQRFYTTKEVASELGLELSTFKKMVAIGQLPQPVQMGKRLRMWTFDDIQAMAWLLVNVGRLRKSTEDEEESELD